MNMYREVYVTCHAYQIKGLLLMGEEKLSTPECFHRNLDLLHGYVTGFHTGVGAPRDFPPPPQLEFPPPQKLSMIMMLCDGSDL